MGIFTGLFKSEISRRTTTTARPMPIGSGGQKQCRGQSLYGDAAVGGVRLYQGAGGIRGTAAPASVRADGTRQKEPAVQHPLYKVLHDQPNPEMTSYTFREVLMTHLLIYGNAYAQIIRNGRGEVLGLYPLAANRVRVEREDSGELVYLYRRYDDANPNFREQGEIRLYDFDVLHIPGMGFDGLVGYSPIALARNAIGLALDCDQYGSSFLPTGQHPAAC